MAASAKYRAAKGWGRVVGFGAAAILAVSVCWGCNDAGGVYEEGEVVGTPHDFDKDGNEPHLQTALLGLYALKPAKTCEEVTSLWRDKAIKLMEAQLEGKMDSILHPEVCYRYDDWGYGEVYLPSADCAAGVPESAYDEEGGNGEKAKEHSETNTQEAGVDEADYLKNDGAYIYVLTGNLLRIIDAWPPEQAHIVSDTEIEGVPRKLYVHKDLAVVYSSLGAESGYQFNECTYSYGGDCEFTGDGYPVKITVLDITDLENPEPVREVRFTGSYLNSRRVEDFVYTIVYHNDPSMPQMKTVPDELAEIGYTCLEKEGDEPNLPFSESKIKALFEELRQENIALIDELDFASWLPQAEDNVIDGGVATLQPNPLADCSGYFLSQTGDGLSLLSLVSFDLTKASGGSKIAASSIVARPGAIYASKQALYIATRHYKYNMPDWFAEYADADETTTVHKFLMASDSPQTGYAGSGVVKGRILNQFSMSDFEGHFRIATTTGHLPDPDVHNSVFVMKIQDGKLAIVGTLDNLAPGEDIRSARFSGTLGFLVTFKKTDPLFVIDLSDPTAPVVEGELKIPGFSTYMHFIDPGHILSIGYDADDMGSFAWFDGIMLQVFDVTDITNPILMHKETIGTRGTTSDAATNHLAFNFFKPKDMLALPMVVCEGGGDGDYGDQMTFNGLMLYNVTVADGFKYVGGVPHQTATQENYYEDDYYYDYEYNSQCYNWWTDSNSTVKRSVFMDDYVYSVASDVIKIATIDNPAEPVAEVSLQ